MSSLAARQPLLTEGPIAKTLLMFALPILGSTVLQSLNGSVNAMWIGHFLGEAALTQMGVAIEIFRGLDNAGGDAVALQEHHRLMR